MSLSAFLSQNALKVENVKHVVSDRFIGEDGKPIEWEIRCIGADENDKIRKSCVKNIPIPGKRGQYQPEMDTRAYFAKLAVACTAFPNLNDQELQDSYGVMGAEALISKMLIAGEFDSYVEKIAEVNRFDVSFQEVVDEAKN